MKNKFILSILGLFLFCFCAIGTAEAGPFVKTQGRQLVVDFDQDGNYEPYFIKGVNYSPLPIGRHVSDWGYPQGYPSPNNILDDDGILTRDFYYLQNMHANTIRLWKANNTTQPSGQFPIKMTNKILSYAATNNIKVIPGFWMDTAGESICSGGTTPVYNTFVDYTNANYRTGVLTRFQAFVTNVNNFTNRGEILFWAIGNETNYSLNRNDLNQIRAYYSLLDLMGGIVRSVEGVNYHPVAIIEGDISFIGRADYGTRDQDLPNIDIWGSNVYRGITFGTLFTEYQAKSTKPLYISEYGADAYHATTPTNPDVGAENQNEQAQWDGLLWDEIAANRGGVAIGASIMEYSDEWWKPSEWKCEDANCRTAISSSNVTFIWDPRIGASSYSLKIGTAFNSGNVYNNTVTGTSLNLTTVPLGVSKIYLQFTYTPTGFAPMTEYMEFPIATPVEASNTVKIKLQGSVHNRFGIGPIDTSCPRNGTIDYVPDAPDQYFHEEWWGLVSISRNSYVTDIVTPRLAYYTLKDKFTFISPFISLGSPTGSLSAGSVSTTLKVATDVNATCRYETVAGTAFNAMRYTFGVTGAKQHSQSINGLAGGNNYTYYVRCQNSQTDVVNSVDYPINFSTVGSYDTWKFQKFTPAEQDNDAISGENANPDGDALVNLLEYAFNLDPKQPSNNANFFQPDSKGYLLYFLNGNSIAAKYRKNLGAQDLTYAVEATDCLSNTAPCPWVSDAFTYMAPQTIDANTQLIQTQPLLFAATSKRFFRIKITKQGNLPSAPPLELGLASVPFYTLTVNNTGSGRITSTSGIIDCGTKCTNDGARGTNEVLSAQPNPGFKFDGWSGACTGLTSCAVNYDSPKTVAAAFSVQAVCGDGNIDTALGEQCDSSNLDGQTCLTKGFSSGTLICNSQCRFESSGCISTEALNTLCYRDRNIQVPFYLMSRYIDKGAIAGPCK